METDEKHCICDPAVVSEKRDVGDDYRAHIEKHIKLLRLPLYQLERAADWLDAWVHGYLEPAPLLRTNARLVCVLAYVFTVPVNFRSAEK